MIGFLKCRQYRTVRKVVYGRHGLSNCQKIGSWTPRVSTKLERGKEKREKGGEEKRKRKGKKEKEKGRDSQKIMVKPTGMMCKPTMPHLFLLV
jgi:hypothetical protein